MGYAVYHLEKKSSLGGGLGNHIDRVEGMEHTYRHADPSRRKFNVIFKVGGYEKLSLSEAVQLRIENGYKQEGKKIRKDAVKYISHVLTGSHQEMKSIFKDAEKAKAWVRANADFIKSEYGSKNIIRLNLHLDEKTPHLHVITVPLTSDGRLSAKEVVGNKKALQSRQDRYAAAMKPFGLKRGLKNTGIKHENAREYYKRISSVEEKTSEIQIKPVEGLFGIDKGKTIQKYENELKKVKKRLKSIELFKKKSQKEKVSMSIANSQRQKTIEKMKVQLQEKNQELDGVLKMAKKVIKSEKLSAQFRAKFLAEEKIVKSEKLRSKKGPRLK